MWSKGSAVARNVQEPAPAFGRVADGAKRPRGLSGFDAIARGNAAHLARRVSERAVQPSGREAGVQRMTDDLGVFLSLVVLLVVGRYLFGPTYCAACGGNGRQNGKPCEKCEGMGVH